MREDARGVSVPLGVTLLFAVVLAGMVVVVTVGTGVMTDTRGQMDVDRAEKVLTQFDSKSAVVALGEADSQEIPLASAGDSQFYVRDEAGWMNVTVTNETSGEVLEIVNVTLGEVAFEDGHDVVAYQGGGVWKETPAGAKMVSPPEFHFRSATLTLPIISVDGDATISGDATVTKPTPSSIRFPNASDDSDFVNPLLNGRVNVTVHSDYYRAWGVYFERRTEGDAVYDHENETVTAELVVPFNQQFDNVMAATAPGGITVNGNDPRPSPSETGVDYPLPDTRIEDRIETCETNASACTTLTSVSTITSPGDYYVGSSYSGNIDVDSPGGNVTVIVNGEYKPEDVTINSNYSTAVLVRNDFTMKSDDVLNGGGVAGNFSVAVHSDGEVDGNGNYKLVGLLYAPGSHCDLNGGGSRSPNIVGGTVCETIKVNGNPNDFQYDDSVEDTDLTLLPEEVTKLTYLHVTVNRIDVTNE